MICSSAVVFVTAAVLFAAKTTSGYDFQSSTFNQLLANDLEDMYSVLHHRARRSPSGEDSNDCHRHFKRKPIMCCAQSAFGAMHEADSEIRNLCFREVTGRDRHETPMRFEPFRCEGMEKRRDEINCVFQCVAQKKGLVDDSGKVVEVSFMEYVKQFIAEAPYMATAMEKVAQDCMKQVNTNITLQGNCYSSGIKLAHCLFRNIQLSCPDEEIKDKEACKLLQEELKGEEGSFPPPPPPE